MSKKIYIHLEEEGFPSQTSKIQVPKTWADKEVTDVIKLFADAYNKKNADSQIDVPKVHFATSDGSKIFSNDKVSAVLDDLGDYYIKQGVHIREHRIETVDKDAIRCKNYGCNQYYKEAENHDSACSHHCGPPVFHDTAKYWSCCLDRKAYDFESFQEIKGCVVSRHTNVAPAVNISASPNAVNRSADAAAAAPLKSIAEFNTSNPTAVSAASAATKTMERKSTRSADGSARCQRKGCQKVFTVAENSATSCSFHAGQPIFHDAAKYWSCCPDKKCYDFDEFLAVPGCAVGVHDDGIVDL